MSKILDMLMDFTQQGYSSEEIKEAVIDTICPFYNHPEKATQYWGCAEMLSVFEFLIRYHYEPEFKEGLIEVLSMYKTAVEMDSERTFSIICDTLFDFSQKENMMWTVRKNVKQINDDDYDEKIINYMKHIGDTLEIGTKHIVLELWALMQLANGVVPDYDKIQKLDFGVVIQNILDKQKLLPILVTPPLTLKLSDWRNIAYHHTYRIMGEHQIMCTYGKKQSSFNISESDLTQYVHKIVRSSNILNIARCIFVFDYDEQIDNYRSNHGRQSIRFRSPILENRLRISMLSQSFFLDSVVEEPQLVVATVTDILNDGKLTKERAHVRYIHASQFLFNLWSTYKKELLQIKYFSAEQKLVFTCSVSGNVCEKIDSGEKELSYMAQYVSFDFLQK